MKRILFPMFLLLGVVFIGPVAPTTAQDSTELAAILEVIEPGVEVQRAETSNWLPVSMESIVGVGDSIRTDATGTARVTFFETASEVEITPNSVFRINNYSGTEADGYITSLEILAGITRQQVSQVLNPNSVYELVTPGMSMTVRGTAFDIRVEEDGRSSLLTADGMVEVGAAGDTADVEPGFGVRSEPEEDLSDVIPATSFEALDAGLDGYDAAFSTDADIRLNVRVGPGQSFERVGSIGLNEIDGVYGISSGGDYFRIAFRGGFGWVSGNLITVDLADNEISDLPVFPDDYLEDVDDYAYLGDALADAVVTRQVVNLRSGPGLEFEILQQLESGDVLSILGRTPDNEWVRGQLIRSGVIGWVNTPLLVINRNLSSIDVIEPPEADTDTASDDEGDDASEADADTTTDDEATTTDEDDETSEDSGS